MKKKKKGVSKGWVRWYLFRHLSIYRFLLGDLMVYLDEADGKKIIVRARHEIVW